MKVVGKAQLAKLGNNLAVKLPRRVVDSAGLQEGDRLNLSVGKDGTIVMWLADRKCRLGDLVSEITPMNRHDETDWGTPVGKEIW